MAAGPASCSTWKMASIMLNWPRVMAKRLMSCLMGPMQAAAFSKDSTTRLRRMG
jgi:hypothetical protein